MYQTLKESSWIFLYGMGWDGIECGAHANGQTLAKRFRSLILHQIIMKLERWVIEGVFKLYRYKIWTFFRHLTHY